MIHATNCERRRTTRREVSVMVEVGAQRHRATNLCLDGLRLEGTRSMNAGSFIDMLVHVPGGRALPMRGSVVGSAEGWAGIEFVRMSSRDRQVIAEFLFG